MKTWVYPDVFRYQFEQKMEYVESLLVRLGAIPLNYYVTQKVPLNGKVVYRTSIPQRMVYRYKKVYLQVNEILFPDKPFIMIRWTDRLERINRNMMESFDPFPYDWSREEMLKEVMSLLKNFENKAS